MAQKREIKEETELKVSDGFEKARSVSLRFSERPDPLQESSEDPGQGQNPGARREVNRCSECRRKVGLTGFRCRCGDLFCSLHRYSDRHECGFDYKAAGRAAIARENPVVRPAKILKV